MTKATENVSSIQFSRSVAHSCPSLCDPMKGLYKYKTKCKLNPGTPPLTCISQDWGAKDLFFLNELGDKIMADLMSEIFFFLAALCSVHDF